MTLRIGKRLFAPRAWSVLLTAIALAAFVSLGNWQLGRAREKQALTASFMAVAQRNQRARRDDLNPLQSSSTSPASLSPDPDAIRSHDSAHAAQISAQ